MDMSVFPILITLVEQACFISIAFLMLFHIKFFQRMLTGKITILDQVILSAIFGAFAIFGTYSGVTTSGCIANIRNIGPMIGGLLGGPWVGLASGLIGGVHRYFLGGFTAIPCGLGTVLSGLIGGLLFIIWKGNLGIWKPALFAFIMEVADMGMILLMAQPFDKAFTAVSVIAAPMILADTLGITIFAFTLHDMRSHHT
ncbi:MAG: hypothetical protein EHM12_02940 [Dehalococcoidia bacterium]|nr:MAG: hypothetical protein EHM12_02940 [Dehalococcoidia bacterium]